MSERGFEINSSLILPFRRRLGISCCTLARDALLLFLFTHRVWTAIGDEEDDNRDDADGHAQPLVRRSNRQPNRAGNPDSRRRLDAVHVRPAFENHSAAKKTDSRKQALKSAAD